MKAIIEIDMGNAAFDDCTAGKELARILRKLASQVEDWPGANEFILSCRDIYGNRVGALTVEKS